MIAEQEKREKTIEKMSKIVITDCKNTCKDCINNYGGCIGNFNAALFYDAGYREAEEVRKEILREVISFIKENRYCAIDDELIEEAYKRFGIELEA